MTPLRVVLAEDHALVAAQLQLVLEEECDVIEVVGNGRALIEADETQRPDAMKPVRLLVLDDYEGELSRAPAMQRLRTLADVELMSRPLGMDDRERLARAQVLLALRERTRLDRVFFEATPSLELILQTGGHAYHLETAAATAYAA